jgi:hypothetical protein
MREEKGPQFSESETLQWALSEFLWLKVLHWCWRIVKI